MKIIEKGHYYKAYRGKFRKKYFTYEAKKLVKKTFADKVIFQNSGAEATEAAIKVARRYFYSIGNKLLY